MNAIVNSALKKLIQDEAFRGELASMLDDVNRAASDPSLISRAEAPVPPPPAEAPAEEKSAGKFEDVKAELLADPAFLKALMDALMAMNEGEQQQRTALISDLTKLRESIGNLERTVKELGTTITEHDGVITAMAEKAIVAEGEKPLTLRARDEKAEDKTTKPVSALEARAARVLTKMGAK